MYTIDYKTPSTSNNNIKPFPITTNNHNINRTNNELNNNNNNHNHNHNNNMILNNNLQLTSLSSPHNNNNNNNNNSPYFQYSNNNLLMNNNNHNNDSTNNHNNNNIIKLSNSYNNEQLNIILNEFRRILIKEIDNNRILENEFNQFKSSTQLIINSEFHSNNKFHNLNINNSNLINQNKMVNNDINHIKSQLKTFQNQIFSLENKLNNNYNNIQSSIINNEIINSNTIKIQELEQELGDFKLNNKQLSNYDTELSNIHRLISGLNTQYDSIELKQQKQQQQYQQLSSSLSQSIIESPSPLKVIEFDTSKLDKSIANLESQLTSLQLIIVNHTNQIKNIQNKELPNITELIHNSQKQVLEIQSNLTGLLDSYPHLQHKISSFNEKLTEIDIIKTNIDNNINNRILTIESHPILQEIWQNKINGLYIQQDRMQTQLNQLLLTNTKKSNNNIHNDSLTSLTQSSCNNNNNNNNNKCSSHNNELEESMKTIRVAIKIVDSKITENNQFNKELTNRIDSAETNYKTCKKQYTELFNKYKFIQTQYKDLETKLENQSNLISINDNKVAAKLENLEKNRKALQELINQIILNNNQNNNNTLISDSSSSSADNNNNNNNNGNNNTLYESLNESYKKVNKRVRLLEESISSNSKQILSSVTLLNEIKTETTNSLEEVYKKFTNKFNKLENKQLELHNQFNLNNKEYYNKINQKIEDLDGRLQTNQVEIENILATKLSNESSIINTCNNNNNNNNNISINNIELIHSSLKPINNNIETLLNNIKLNETRIQSLDTGLKLIENHYNINNNKIMNIETIQLNSEIKLNKLIPAIQNLVNKFKFFEENNKLIDLNGFQCKLSESKEFLFRLIETNIKEFNSIYFNNQYSNYTEMCKIANEAHVQLSLNAKELDLLTRKTADLMASNDDIKINIELLAKHSKCILPKNKFMQHNTNNNINLISTINHNSTETSAMQS